MTTMNPAQPVAASLVSKRIAKAIGLRARRRESQRSADQACVSMQFRIEFKPARSIARLILENGFDRHAVHFALFGLWHAIYRDNVHPVRNGSAEHRFENACAPRDLQMPSCPWLNQRVPCIGRWTVSWCIR